MFYDDVDNKPISSIEWAKLKESGTCLNLKTRVGKYEVSTVWMGLDHNFFPTGPPLIYESMVFDRESGESDLDMERYSTRVEAEEGHKRMVQTWELFASAESSVQEGSE